MRDVSEEMRNATGELRRQDPMEASQRGARALEKLQAIERQLQSAAPDEQRRVLGELQLEARQLADAERHAASELAQAGQGEAARDALRRLAGEQERLATRAERVQEGLKQAAAAAPSGKAADEEAEKIRQRAAGAAVRDAERQRLADRMREAAGEIRAAAGQTDASTGAAAKAKGQTAGAAATEQDIARALDRLADALATPGGPRDETSQRLADQRAKAQELRSQIDTLTGAVEKLQARGASPTASRRAQKSSGDSGKEGQGQAGGGAGGTDLAQLREQYLQQLQQTRDLMAQLQRDDPAFAQGAAGFTFDGQGMTLSAPGTEAFKQDFARWQRLSQQATQALEHAEELLSQKLQAKEAHDRLAAGADDKPPAAYQTEVDSYFKALAGKKH